ncbi:helix-turn-helix domain-containing protein [Streptomyces sp. SAJ15]|uniref:ArsR/SmtB family transcription factor n=1 Tax=Streptomyces sp. SAJ15 TaxID=2011095 RepID=UPI0021B22D67|nr:helix-turn-helix domain-containing protein [Streptomyces sp. SAJ15]
MRFTETAAEDLGFSVSPLLEAVHSWHVLTDPGHHALHVPWVRRCRRLPAALRQQMREYGFVVADYIPAFFECRADDHDADFADQLSAVRTLPAEQLAAELAQTLVDTTRYDGHDLVENATTRDAALAELQRTDRGLAARLGDVLTDPLPILEGALTVLEDYWSAAFAEEWERLEPTLYEAIASAGQRIAHQGVFPMLRTLVPQIRIDPARRTLRLDRPHDHDIAVTPARPVTFTASHYVWPHVRVTCDAPWPLRITYPALPLAPASTPRPASQEELLSALRALAAAPRLHIATCLATQSRSTQELATLLGLSQSVISRHLQQMTQAGLTTTRRDGYYVLYSLDPTRLDQIAAALAGLATPHD